MAAVSSTAPINDNFTSSFIEDEKIFKCDFCDFSCRYDCTGVEWNKNNERKKLSMLDGNAYILHNPYLDESVGIPVILGGICRKCNKNVCADCSFFSRAEMIPNGRISKSCAGVQKGAKKGVKDGGGKGTNTR